MQHLIVRLRKLRPALSQILEDHSEKNEDTDTAMMTWEKYEQAWTVINPKFNAKSRVSTLPCGIAKAISFFPTRVEGLGFGFYQNPNPKL